MICFYTAGHSAAIDTAAKVLRTLYPFSPGISSRITHLLLPVPSFDGKGYLKGGGDLVAVLESLPANVTVIGGRLDSPLLEGYETIDLLEDPFYLAHNARITAHCALKHAMNRLPVTMEDCSALVLGWGRIGKCLSSLLQKMGAAVTVYARKEDDRAAASSLGFETAVPEGMNLSDFQVIFNTVPKMLLPNPPEGPLLIDLASEPGIGGKQVLQARHLPGRDAPDSSGMLIARTIVRLMHRKEARI